MRNGSACASTHEYRKRNVCVTEAHVPVRTSTGSVCASTHEYRKRNVCVPEAIHMVMHTVLNNQWLSIHVGHKISFH